MIKNNLSIKLRHLYQLLSLLINLQFINSDHFEQIRYLFLDFLCDLLAIAYLRNLEELIQI